MSDTGASLEVVDLKKSWGAVEVLSGVSFQIEAGGFLTLLGPSGCGKSTALRLVTGLDDVSGGKILIDGKDMTRTPAAGRNLGMVFQNYALFPHMTVEENIAYGLRVRKVARDVQRKSIDRVAELMALGNLLDRRPAQLSGGQQQRVALARVLVSDRPLVLMDEPLSNLDAKLRTEIRSEIRALNKKLGITVVYVTHDQSEALSMSDTVVLMNKGSAVQIGKPSELYETPANVFAAGFIGTPPMNLIDGAEVTVPEDLASTVGGRPEDVLVGVRPETMRLNGKDKALSVAARVTSVEYEGSVHLVHLATGSGAKFVLSHAGKDAPAPGDKVVVGWDRSSAHLFRKETGLAIRKG